MNITQVQQALWALSDPVYRKFQQKLIPTRDPDTIIGVRTPALRALAKKLGKEDMSEFLKALPHTYYEENNLHAELIMQMRDFDACIAALNAFLPYVDNWATCDLLSPKVLIKQPEALLKNICRWMASDKPYTVRFGLEILMTHFLDDRFKPEYLQMAAQVESAEYYVNMMVAWFFATALTKQYDAALPYLQNRVLPEWTHRKTIQKAIESYRITPEQKTYLRSLK